MRSAWIIESNSDVQGESTWYPVYMHATRELAEIALKPLVKRWPDAYRITEYVPAIRYRPDGTLRSSRA